MDGFDGHRIEVDSIPLEVESVSLVMAKGGHSHRSTLKKDHKPFKSKHATKGQLKNQSKGKVEKSGKASGKGHVYSKTERKNFAKQVKDRKIAEAKLARKVFEGSHGTEKIVTIIPLTDDISAVEMASMLFNFEFEGESDAEHKFESPSVKSLRIKRFKSNVKVILPEQNDMIAILDATKVSDFIIFGLSALKEAEETWGEQILRAVIAQGVSSVIGVLPNIVTAYPKKNFQLDIRQSLTSYFKHFFPSEEKLYALENDTECLNCLRIIAQKFPKGVTWRDSRAYIVADDISWSQENEMSGTLCVEGSVRGTGLNLNRLVHISGYGDFQLERIEIIPKVKNHDGMDLESTDAKVFSPSEEQESLNEINPEEVVMDDAFEEEDIYEDEHGIRMDGKYYFEGNETEDLAKKHKAPDGMSDYQARWLLEDDAEIDSISEDGMQDGDGAQDMMVESDHEIVSQENEREEEEEEDMYVELSDEEEARQLEHMRSKAKENLEFPDELELDPSEIARERFAKHRGVKSLGNSDWYYDEVDENAPSDWKRLLRVRNFKATKDKCKKDFIKDIQVQMGNRVKLYIRAPQAILDETSCTKRPFVIYELLQHEHKKGVCNFSFETWEAYEDPVPSNEPLIVQYGARRQVISPLFNQASNTSNNVHKFERFVYPGNTAIATCIAPVMLGNVPAIFFKPTPDGIRFVGKGTFLNNDFTRIISERSIITGDPVKIHKRVVTVRYMFFNPEDVKWFKAVPLFTKLGRTGFIKESLGTHGYFKATFDGKLTSQDVVAMSLYKRLWPEPSTMWNH